MSTPSLAHRFFVLTALAKGIDGILEIAGSLVLFLAVPDQLHGWTRALMQHELSEDPQDRLAHFLLQGTRHLGSAGETFAAVYLLWHGLVKAGLVTALLLKVRWAYPAAIAAFLLFLFYQLYRYVLGRSLGLLLLSVLDVFVIALTYLEFRRLRSEEQP